MNPLLRLLFENPILAFILLAWIASAIGGALQKARRTAEQQRRREAPPPPARPEQMRRSEQQVADELREILGVEPRVRREPAEVPARRDPTAGDWGRESGEAPPLARPAERRVGDTRIAAGTEAMGGRRLGRLESHIGEKMQARSQPASGQVGGQQLGRLPGHTGPPSRRPPRGGTRSVDLSNLGRLVVAREILDPPVAMR
jgi:hypothetical protein